MKNNPSDYDRVVIITPFWAASPTPAVRGFAKQHYEQLKGKKLGLVITNLGSEPDEAFKKYEEIFPEPLVKQCFTKAKKEWFNPIEGELIARFVEEVND